jgi:hypothetical protein
MDMNNVTDFRGQLARFRKANQVTIVVTAEDGLTTLPLTLRKIGLEDLLFSGQIPDSLSGLVNGMLTGNQQTMVEAQNLGKLGQLFDHVMLACVVEPPLAEVGDELHLGVDEIPFAVKEATFQWVNGEALALDPFRPQPGRNGASALPGEDLRPTAEPVAQPTEQLDSVPA